MRGFTLTELMITVLIVAALAGISYPLIRSGIRSAHKAECLSNLRQLGTGLELYLQDNNSIMPDLEAGRRDRAEDIPVLETVLSEYVESAEVFHCPADNEQFAKSGSSYVWNSTQSGLRRNKLSFFGNTRPERIPLIIDKEAWHPGDEGTHFLYADMTATNKVHFVVSE